MMLSPFGLITLVTRVDCVTPGLSGPAVYTMMSDLFWSTEYAGGGTVSYKLRMNCDSALNEIGIDVIFGMNPGIGISV